MEKHQREQGQNLDQAVPEVPSVSGLSLLNLRTAFTHLLLVSLSIMRDAISPLPCTF